VIYVTFQLQIHYSIAAIVEHNQPMAVALPPTTTTSQHTYLTSFQQYFLVNWH